MSTTGLLIVLAVSIAALLVAAKIVRSWLRLRGLRVVTCPETGCKTGVKLDARHAALSGAVSAPAMRLSVCDRWPEKQGCGQECLAEVSRTGEGCLVRSILTHWYAGKRCANCGAEIGPIDWSTRRPALMTPAGTTLEWSQIAAAEMDTVLTTHRPVCFSCGVTNTFVRQHPDMIVDRSLQPR